MRHDIRRLTVGAMVVVGLAMGLGDVRGNEPVKDAASLETMAREADTSREHAQVAKEYRLRAEDFDAKAAAHEATARKLRGSRNPMSYKWPALAAGGSEREAQLAIHARRAAQECRTIAAKHVGLAVETQHTVTNTR